MAHEIEVQRATAAGQIPRTADIRRWAGAALSLVDGPCGVAVRIVDGREGRGLNRRYRGIDRSTNVLSFPAERPAALVEELDCRPLGDVVLCAPRVVREAREQGKPACDHWAHLTMHGVLHLLGHDHQTRAEARRMESLERRLLAGLGIPDPYAPRQGVLQKQRDSGTKLERG